MEVRSIEGHRGQSDHSGCRPVRVGKSTLLRLLPDLALKQEISTSLGHDVILPVIPNYMIYLKESSEYTWFF